MGAVDLTVACWRLPLFSLSLSVAMNMRKISQSPKFMLRTLLSSSRLQLKSTLPFRFCDQMAEQYVSTMEGVMPLTLERRSSQTWGHCTYIALALS